jgi:hypothetical protein
VGGTFYLRDFFSGGEASIGVPWATGDFCVQVQKDLPSFAEQFRLSLHADDFRMSLQLSPPLHEQIPFPQANVAAAGKLAAAHIRISTTRKSTLDSDFILRPLTASSLISTLASQQPLTPHT